LHRRRIDRLPENPSVRFAGTPIRGLDAIRFPLQHRRLPGGVLHAKVIVMGDRVALVSSANLTSRVIETSLECGILIGGVPQRRAIRRHITELRAQTLLRRLG